MILIQKGALKPNIFSYFSNLDIKHKTNMHFPYFSPFFFSFFPFFYSIVFFHIHCPRSLQQPWTINACCTTNTSNAGNTSRSAIGFPLPFFFSSPFFPFVDFFLQFYSKIFINFDEIPVPFYQHNNHFSFNPIEFHENFAQFDQTSPKFLTKFLMRNSRIR